MILGLEVKFIFMTNFFRDEEGGKGKSGKLP